MADVLPWPAQKVDSFERQFLDAVEAYRYREWGRAYELLRPIVREAPNYEAHGYRAADLLARAEREMRRHPFPVWAWALLGVLVALGCIGIVGGLIGGIWASRPVAPAEVMMPPSSENSIQPLQPPSALEAPALAYPTDTPFPTYTPLPTDTPFPTDTPLPAVRPGDLRQVDSDGMVQVFVPYGNGLWVDRTEVTNGMYRLCVQAGFCQPPVKDTFYNLFAYYSDPAFDDYPVVYVSWQMANRYCSWAGRRLPSSDEWAAAARGTDGRIYPWGNREPEGSRANICDVNCTLDELKKKRNPGINDGYPFTAPVGSYPAGASPYGALDMAGNVWEWTSTPYGGGYYVIRGGGWTSDSQTSRADFINSYDQNAAWVDTGFRCVTEP